MASSCTALLILPLLILATMRGCSGQDRGSVRTQDVCTTLEKVPQNLPEIKKVVQAYSKDSNWTALTAGLLPLLDKTSEVYRQLQASVLLYGVGEAGYIQLASLLLCAGLPVDMGLGKQHTMMEGATFGGHLQLVKLLLDNGAALNKKGLHGYTPLMYAAWGGHLPVVKWLVEAGADTTPKSNSGYTALDIASEEAVVQYLEQFPH